MEEKKGSTEDIFVENNRKTELIGTKDDTTREIRVRFAPSPTGFMHIGNARTALINYLFAKAKNGKFIVRIEDTDYARNNDEAGYDIERSLDWLKIVPDEGPIKGGPFGPYLQSQRKDLYDKILYKLIEAGKVYRCFCSEEELEKKREEQLLAGKPPKYDRTCANLSEEVVKEKIANGEKFIWRFRVNDDELITVKDEIRGEIEFEAKNFSDFAITRSDLTYKFIFTNFVDDMLMKISDVIRGEDHLTNTAMQIMLFNAVQELPPRYWHLPILCNVDGKKLSKRELGFHLGDLQKQGFLSEAVISYLASIGTSLKDEISTIDELAKNYDLRKSGGSGTAKFDVDKLIWFNQAWMKKIKIDDLVKRLQRFIERWREEDSEILSKIDTDNLAEIVAALTDEVKTMNELVDIIGLILKAPKLDKELVEKEFCDEEIKAVSTVLSNELSNIRNTRFFISRLETEMTRYGVKPHKLFKFTRLAITGKKDGIAVKKLIELIGPEEAEEGQKTNLYCINRSVNPRKRSLPIKGYQQKRITATQSKMDDPHHNTIRNNKKPAIQTEKTEFGRLPVSVFS